MKARDVIGRKIIKVHQKYCHAVDGYPGAWNVTRFTLDNGATVWFDATPHGVYEVVEVKTYKPEAMRDEVKEAKIEAKIARDSTEEDDL